MSNQPTTCPDTDYPTTETPASPWHRVEIRTNGAEKTVTLDGKRWKGLHTLAIEIAPMKPVLVHATFYAEVDGKLDHLTMGEVTLSRNPAADGAGEGAAG